MKEATWGPDFEPSLVVKGKVKSAAVPQATFLPTPLASPQSKAFQKETLPKNSLVQANGQPLHSVTREDTFIKSKENQGNANEDSDEAPEDKWADAVHHNNLKPLKAAILHEDGSELRPCCTTADNTLAEEADCHQKWNPSPISIELEQVLQETSLKLDSMELNEGPASIEALDVEDAPSKSDTLSLDDCRRGSPKACLFVASLTLSVPDDALHQELEQLFSKYGKLTSVKVCRDFMFRPFAFVHFEKVEEARRALKEAANTPVSGRPIRIEQARVNRTLFVAKYSRLMNDQRLRALFAQFGPLEGFTILQNYETGKPRDCGFVKYKYREDATRAFMQLRSMNLRIVLEWAENMNSFDRDVDEKTIFVGHLNQYKVTEQLLQAKFQEYGEIVKLTLIQRPPQGSFVRPAFAFIEYDSAESAETAFQMEDGQEWLERIIKVQMREVSMSLDLDGAPETSGKTASSQKIKTVKKALCFPQQQHSATLHRYGNSRLFPATGSAFSGKSPSHFPQPQGFRDLRQVAYETASWPVYHQLVPQPIRPPQGYFQLSPEGMQIYGPLDRLSWPVSAFSGPNVGLPPLSSPGFDSATYMPTTQPIPYGAGSISSQLYVQRLPQLSTVPYPTAIPHSTGYPRASSTVPLNALPTSNF